MPSWICYIIMRDYPRSLFIGPHQPVKFYANRMCNFEDMAIWFFCRFCLKCLFTPKKFRFLGVKTPKRDWSLSRPPKGTSLAETALYMPILVEIGQAVRPGRVMKKPKKGWERNLEWQTGCSPRPPTLTQRYVVLRAGWSSGVISKFQVSSKSVEQFSRSGGSKFAISYT